MKLKEFYDEVARNADTDSQKISAAEVSRVLRVAGDVLRDMKAWEFVDLMDDWLERD